MVLVIQALRRAFVPHCILPFICLILIIRNLVLVYVKDQTSPIEGRMLISKSFTDIYPVFISKDIVSSIIMLVIMCVLCLIYPKILQHKLSYIPADYYTTPSNIEPEWYFLPYYAVLKTFESKVLDVLTIAVLLFALMFIPNIYNTRLLYVIVQSYKLHSITTFISLILLDLIGKCRYTRLVSRSSKLYVL